MTSASYGTNEALQVRAIGIRIVIFKRMYLTALGNDVAICRACGFQLNREARRVVTFKRLAENYVREFAGKFNYSRYLLKNRIERLADNFMHNSI